MINVVLYRYLLKADVANIVRKDFIRAKLARIVVKNVYKKHVKITNIWIQMADANRKLVSFSNTLILMADVNHVNYNISK